MQISSSHSHSGIEHASRGRILIVDDDPGLLKLLTIRLRAEHYEVEAVESAEEALGVLTRFRPDLVISDLRMANMDGIELLREIHRQRPGLCVLLLTAHGTIPDAVTATQSGAFGFLTKPVDKNELFEHVERAMKISGQAGSRENWSADIITRSATMEEALKQAQLVAPTDTRILITGESGTGKELMARAIHRASSRSEQPFVAINCSAMSEDLLESELFGHEKGAFTGAHRNHEGLFQAADGGTLLLDELGDMPPALQVKLLRVLQESQVRPVGSTQTIKVDARIIAATNANLREMVDHGRFREDLFYRLNVVNIHLPALRERREDVPLLIEHFLDRIAETAGQERKVYAPEAVELLVAHDWPGNVRQLYNVVNQNVALCTTRVIAVELVRNAIGEQAQTLPSFTQARDEFTRNYLSRLLQITGGNVSQAARLAKRNRTDFYKLLSRHSLVPERFK